MYVYPSPSAGLRAHTCTAHWTCTAQVPRTTRTTSLISLIEPSSYNSYNYNSSCRSYSLSRTAHTRYVQLRSFSTTALARANHAPCQQTWRETACFVADAISFFFMYYNRHMTFIPAYFPNPNPIGRGNPPPSPPRPFFRYIHFNLRYDAVLGLRWLVESEHQSFLLVRCFRVLMAATARRVFSVPPFRVWRR